MKIAFFWALMGGFAVVYSATAFEGRVTAAVTRAGETHSLLYTVGTNFLRIDCLETDHPYASDILDTGSREMTLVFHHNRSFVRFPLSDQNTAPPPGVPPMAPDFPQAPPAFPGAMPATIGPTNLPGIQPGQMPQMPRIPSASNLPGMPTMGMPMMPPMPEQAVELKDTGETTNILGYPCAHYKIHQRDETMDVWATGQLPPFQPYLQNQPHRFGPRRIEEQWGGLLADRKLFPLLASLKLQNGFERLHFEVTEIQPEKIEDKDGSLSQPPPGYNEIQPLPF